MSRRGSWQPLPGPSLTGQVISRCAWGPGIPAGTPSVPHSLTLHTSGSDKWLQHRCHHLAPSDPAHFVLPLKPVGGCGGALSLLPLLHQPSPGYLQACALIPLERDRDTQLSGLGSPATSFRCCLVEYMGQECTPVCVCVRAHVCVCTCVCARVCGFGDVLICVPSNDFGFIIYFDFRQGKTASFPPRANILCSSKLFS